MSLHIEANIGDISETVLLPGDPLRAKWIADSFLTNTICYNNIRGMLGYTGFYKGKRVSVQGTGIGIPSTLVYCNELINDYKVQNLIRVGSAGSYQQSLNLGDIVIAMSASSTSNINNLRFRNANFSPTANYELFMKAVLFAQSQNIEFKAGNILSADEFYEDDDNAYKIWAKYGILCVEMETSGLYTIASKFNVNALSILTISDSLITGEKMEANERATSFKPMIEIALSTL